MTFRDRKVSKFKKSTKPTHAVADEIHGKTGQKYSIFTIKTRSAQSQANTESREHPSQQHHKPQNTS